MDLELRRLERRLERDADDAPVRRELTQALVRSGRPLAAQAVLSRARFSPGLVLETLAASDVAVVVVGGHGTPKARLACEIHDASARCEAAFHVEDASEIADEALEVELFGYQYGAMTPPHDRRRAGLFEMATGGTAFLEGLREPSLGRVGRVLETGGSKRLGARDEVAVDVRMILRVDEASRRRFRAFFDRMQNETLWLPPLRERRLDIPLLLEHRRSPAFSPAAMDALMSYGWPRNDRELHAEVDRLLALGRERVERSDLSDRLRRARA
jgi:DNA-binding NtrC family response regulator